MLKNPLPAGTSYRNVNEYTLGLWENARRIHDTLTSNLERAREKQKLAYDKTARFNHVYQLGDKVKLINYAKVIGKSTGFLDKFLGPYEITKFQGVTYTVCDINGVNQTVHYNRLLPYYERYTAPFDVIEEYGVKVPRFTAVDNESVEIRNLRKSSRIFYKIKAKRKMAANRMIVIENDDENDGENDGGDRTIEDSEEPELLVEAGQSRRKKIKVTSFIDGPLNNSGKPTKVCPGCDKALESIHGIHIHLSRCQSFIDKYEKEGEKK